MNSLKFLLLVTIINFSLAQPGYEGNENLYIGNVDGKIVKCLVCKETVKEVRDAQAKVDPKKKAEVKAGRFNLDGSLSGQLIEFRKSEQYLTELFEGDEGICKTMDDYAKAKYKSSGKLVVLKMFVDGGMNPLMSEVDFVQDQDLNKSLKHYCLEVLDEFDEVFLEYFMAPALPKDLEDKICNERTKLCKPEYYEEVEVEEEEEVVEKSRFEEEL
ncbi:hypothetical protein PVAND_013806 [Polypedilum vanderplanki]|uniref:DUF3456 domain-containing protein n=1 Tax=Polypedilum vanderplanki TaxID=319348 RepID=A0A9J6CRC9_POLVA|nr:hypothetical protein PVAND_013806 [Polypedilum vanderplanki]